MTTQVRLRPGREWRCGCRCGPPTLDGYHACGRPQTSGQTSCSDCWSGHHNPEGACRACGHAYCVHEEHECRHAKVLDQPDPQGRMVIRDCSCSAWRAPEA